jgi:hypothetical protein
VAGEGRRVAAPREDRFQVPCLPKLFGHAGSTHFHQSLVHTPTIPDAVIWSTVPSAGADMHSPFALSSKMEHP